MRQQKKYMAKVHLLSIPDSTFSEIITRQDLEFVNNLTKLYYWQHYQGFKILIREEKPQNLIDQLNLHDLEYQHNSVFITF
jgi:hypothetical protein